jgi:hypothetical protein
MNNSVLIVGVYLLDKPSYIRQIKRTEVIEVYLNQLSIKLQPNGIGFIHHSNLREIPTGFFAHR